MTLKRKYSEINNIDINIEEYITPSQIKNYILRDTLIDYLEYYNIEKLDNKPNKKKKNINRPTLFEDFIKTKGIEYESQVINNFPCKYVCIETKKNGFIETLEALKNRIPVIYQGILVNTTNKTFGCPDIIIRGDYLNKYFNKQENPDLYYIIDIKYSTIKLSADKTYILNSDMIPSYKSQILIYTTALNEILNQNVKKGFILGRKYISESCKIKQITYNTKYNILGCINYGTDDIKYIELTNNALKWIRKLRTDGSKWSLKDSPLVEELYPNMSNTRDGIWRKLKKELAEEIKELTLIVNVGPEQRSLAFKHKIYSFDDPRCNSSILNLNGRNGIIVDNILEINSKNSRDLIKPEKIKFNEFNWRQCQYNEFEFYIDYETTTDFNDNNYIFMIGVGYKMTTWEFKNIILEYNDRMNTINMFNTFWNFIDSVLIKYGKTEAIFYHWTHAEVSFYNNTVKQFNFRQKRFIDLHKIFTTEPIVIKNAYNYSLKTIANVMFNHNMIKTKWDSNSTCLNGLDALVAAHKLYDTKLQITENDMQDIADYNEIDCKVLCEILEYLRLNH